MMCDVVNALEELITAHERHVEATNATVRVPKSPLLQVCIYQLFLLHCCCDGHVF